MKVASAMLVVSPAAAFLAQQPVKTAATKRYSYNSRSGMPSGLDSRVGTASATGMYGMPAVRDVNSQTYGTPAYDSRVGSAAMTGVGRIPTRDMMNSPTYERTTPNTLYDSAPPVTAIQGNSLRTWSFYDPRIERVQVVLATEGRPLKSNLEVWEGPDNTPFKLDVYLEDGYLRPFNALIDVPGGSNSISVRNTGQLEFPISASIKPENTRPREMGRGRVIQGGAVHTIPFDPTVQSVELLLRTDGRPMTARIELMQGPYNDKQVMEVYCQDGMYRPFRAVIQTPGVGNVVRIVNTATIEFPLTATCEPLNVMSMSR